MAEAISHEAGHTLGLSHDGSSTVGYYQGHGAGATGWAPIMGVGYYEELVQWSKGEYTGANNTEDDVAVIQNNGASLRADDVGNSQATATPLGGVTSGGVVNVNQGGLIERNTDQDFFSFASGAGPLQITVTPDARSPNLDASIELLDAAGNVVASANPSESLDATLDVNVSAGAYYLKVDGVGKGDLATGYSDYGSRGRYSITGNYTDSGAVPPIAVATTSNTSGYAPLEVGFSSDGSSDSDGAIVAYQWNFGDGTSSTSANPLHTYTTSGTFYPVLTVTDSQGLKATATLTINVAQNPLASTLYIHGINLTTKLTNRRYYQCVASVTVKNFSGATASAAKVSGKWSGVTTSGTVTAATNASGVATFTSTKTTAHGTCTFTVNGVTLTGYTYDPSQNLESLDSLTY